METINLIVSGLGIIISLIAIFFTWHVYKKHDSEIKEQTKLLNKYQLDKIKSDEDDSKKAIVEANPIPYTKDSVKVKVYNKGKSVARNVHVEIPEGLTISNSPFPANIQPQNSREIILFKYESTPNDITLNIKWEDDFQLDNEKQSVIQL